MVKSFTLGGTKWKVKNEPKRLQDLGVSGLCEYMKSTISLDPTIESEDVIEHTFYHELVHGILDTLGYNDLSADERLVDGFSLLLHQFNKSKK